MSCFIITTNIVPNMLMAPLLGSDLQGGLDNDHTFKPGWKDIFRMNQNELESEIRKVSGDSSLDPRRKAYLLQNLLTRFVLL